MLAYLFTSEEVVVLTLFTARQPGGASCENAHFAGGETEAQRRPPRCA